MAERTFGVERVFQPGWSDITLLEAYVVAIDKNIITIKVATIEENFFIKNEIKNKRIIAYMIV